MTYAQQLEQVQAAIGVIENTGQEYTINGVTYKRADLKTLYTREERLLLKINRAANGGKTVAQF